MRTRPDRFSAPPAARSYPEDRPALVPPGRRPTTKGLSDSPPSCIRCKDVSTRTRESFRRDRCLDTTTPPPLVARDFVLPVVAAAVVVVVLRVGDDDARCRGSTVPALRAPPPVVGNVAAGTAAAAAVDVGERCSTIPAERRSAWRCAAERSQRGRGMDCG